MKIKSGYFFIIIDPELGQERLHKNLENPLGIIHKLRRNFFGNLKIKMVAYIGTNGAV